MKNEIVYKELTEYYQTEKLRKDKIRFKNSDKRIEFLNSPAGTEWFRDQTIFFSRQERSRLKKTILYPKLTKSEIQRMEWNEKIDQAIKEKED